MVVSDDVVELIKEWAYDSMHNQTRIGYPSHTVEYTLMRDGVVIRGGKDMRLADSYRITRVDDVDAAMKKLINYSPYLFDIIKARYLPIPKQNNDRLPRKYDDAKRIMGVSYQVYIRDLSLAHTFISGALL